MKKINFEDGQLVRAGYVEIDGVRHEITEAEYEGNTPLSSYVLNKMQDNIETDINTVKEHKYTKKITQNISAGTPFIIPCNYKVGQDVLDVYLNGDRLIKTTSEHARTL